MGEKVEREIKNTIEQIVDFMMPALTPYELSIYIYLFRNTHLKNNTDELRIGKRSIAKGYGKGSRGEKTNLTHINKILKSLEEKGCIVIGDSNRLGTKFVIKLPEEIPFVNEVIKSSTIENVDDDYFNSLTKRHIIFERDDWICQYCGEKVTEKNATLDHYLPQSKGGNHSKRNLKTCCFICNSIKSGKSYEEVAPQLLKSIQERRAKFERTR